MRSIVYWSTETIRLRPFAKTDPLTVISVLSVLIFIVIRFLNPWDSSVTVSLTAMPRSFATNSAFTILTGTWRIGSSRPFKASRVTYFMLPA